MTDSRRGWSSWPQSADALAIGACTPLLRREGFVANGKKVYRLYSAAELVVRHRRKRKGVPVEREALALPDRPNEVWPMHFVSDALANGRRIKILTILDDFGKESVDLLADFGILGHYVTRILDQAARFRGYPAAIRTDQGPHSPAITGHFICGLLWRLIFLCFLLFKDETP